MKKRFFTLFIWCMALATGIRAQDNHQWKSGLSGGFAFRYVTNDPTKTRFYTLKNGLTVILSQNRKAPNVVFKMAVRAGSNQDPRASTGLAHYLEHLLFKGTDRFGTIDYDKEKPYLEKIELLYEKYNQTSDPLKRKEIYALIDKTSVEASSYSIANEYDKMMKAIGSKGTNAHTSVEETVYEEDLPSNAIDKFLAVQAERFRSPVFRIFHTELEAVYEEKNRGLDNDAQKMYEKMLSALFPTHNYGQQTTIGMTEHLKNPSLVEIRKYYNKYYVPNNMALIMAGDFDYDELIKKINQHFSYMVPKPLALYRPVPEKPLTQIQKIEILGPSAENLYIAYRGFAQNSRQSLMLDLIGSILANGKAGLLDINLNKEQKLLRAQAGYSQMKDYGYFVLSGFPKAGQSLQDVQKLLLEQIELLKKGEFEESLIKATVANYKLNELQAYESNDVRAQSTLTSFIQNRGVEWEKCLASTDLMAKITKKELMEFANKFFTDNYVVVLKYKGEGKDIAKVEKPAITAIKTNADQISTFAKTLIDLPVKPTVPKFLDYSRDLKLGKINGADVIYVENKDNGIFNLTYRFDMGSYHNKLLPYAAQYLSYLNSDKYSAEEFSKAFYNIACSYNVNVGGEVTTISISGLEENFAKATMLVEDILLNCKPNEKALQELKERLLKNRENAKLNKSYILNGLMYYAQFGKENPFNYVLSNQEINEMKAEDLISILHKLTSYKHTITYFGPQDDAKLKDNISKIHHLPENFLATLAPKKFVYQKTDANKVYFADYDMVQAEVRWVRNVGLYDPSDVAKVSLFNNYFGNDMGSVVFQSIRESKALAYSTFVSYLAPNSREKESAVIGYVGTQADKMNDAVTALDELLKTMPESERSFALSKANVLNGLENTRIINENIIYKYLADKKLGFTHDSRVDEYKALKTLTFHDVKDFHQNNLSGKPYNYCIIASEKRISLADLEKIAPVTKLNMEQIFGY